MRRFGSCKLRLSEVIDTDRRCIKKRSHSLATETKRPAGDSLAKVNKPDSAMSSNEYIMYESRVAYVTFLALYQIRINLENHRF